MADRDVRYFDFEQELIVELADPEVRAAYQAWRQLVEVEQVNPWTVENAAKTDAAKNKFMRLAREKGATKPLT